MGPCRALIRVRMPDRPGALGLVASRIGAVKGDIVGIEIVDRDGGAALDEFAVALSDASLLPTVEREIGEVDGAAVVQIQVVDAFLEPRLDELEFALAASRVREVIELGPMLAAHIDELVRPRWTRVTGPGVAVTAGPDAPSATGTAGEIFRLPASGITVEIAGAAPLTPSRRVLVTAYCDLVDALWTQASAESRPPAAAEVRPR